MNTSASALQIFLVSVIPDPHSLHFCIALCCHGFTVRPRCQGTVGVVSRNLVCPKPYSVCISARRPTFITPDRASSRMHSLASAKNWAQCVFPSKQYANRHFFETLFPAVSYNLLSRQSTFPTHMTLFPQSLDIFPQFQLIDLMLVYRLPHCPLTVLLTDALAMNAVTDMFFCWRWFLLPLCTVCRSCNTRHRIPEYRLPLFEQIAIAHLRCAKILMSVSAQYQEPPFKFGPSFCCDSARIVTPMTTSVHSPLTRRPTNSTPTYSAVRWDSWYLTRIQVQSYTWP